MNTRYEEPAFFSSAFEALFHRTLKGKMTDALKARFRELGVDPDLPLKAAYGYETWEEVVTAAARAVHPGAGDVEASYRLGLDFFDGFNATVIGKAAVGLARLVGPERTLARFTQNMRNTNNMVEGIVETYRPGFARLRMQAIEKFRDRVRPSPPHVPHYVRGMLLGVLRGLALSEPKVQIASSSPEIRCSIYELEWRV